ncbi:MAG: hypothetical protein HGA87_00375 [Desulfobulbaceae bacterium]|nr:hypothetical protein [Desulfobulbaceae bacterium]
MLAWNEYPETRDLLCYNLNNSKNKIDGNLNKGKGLIKGRADFSFYWRPSVLFIEMKTYEKGSKQAKEQKAWQVKVESRGHRYVICRSLEEFKIAIEREMYGRSED